MRSQYKWILLDKYGQFFGTMSDELAKAAVAAGFAKFECVDIPEPDSDCGMPEEAD